MPKSVDVNKWFSSELERRITDKYGYENYWGQVYGNGWGFNIDFGDKEISVRCIGGYGRVVIDGIVRAKVPYGDPTFFASILAHIHGVEGAFGWNPR